MPIHQAFDEAVQEHPEEPVTVRLPPVEGELTLMDVGLIEKEQEFPPLAVQLSAS